MTTKEAVEALVATIEADLNAIIEPLVTASERMDQLERGGRGVNGLATLMKSHGTSIEAAIVDFRKEAQEIRRRYLGQTMEPITERTSNQGAS